MYKLTIAAAVASSVASARRCWTTSTRVKYSYRGCYDKDNWRIFTGYSIIERLVEEETDDECTFLFKGEDACREEVVDQLQEGFDFCSPQEWRNLLAYGRAELPDVPFSAMEQCQVRQEADSKRFRTSFKKQFYDRNGAYVHLTMLESPGDEKPELMCRSDEKEDDSDFLC